VSYSQLQFVDKEELIREISEELGGSMPQSQIHVMKWKNFGFQVVKEFFSKRFYSPMLKMHTVSKGERKTEFVHLGQNNLFICTYFYETDGSSVCYSGRKNRRDIESRCST